MYTTRYWLGALLVLLTAASAGAQQLRNITVDEMRHEKRVALIIGNASYPTARLNNPVNDARAMAQVLRQLGFDVLSYENVNYTQFRRGVARFGEKIADGGVGVFYYSGHGMQVSGKNYMIPVDAQIKSERYMDAETVDVDSVLAQMDQAKNRLNIVILDACRDNPFARRFRGGPRGLNFMDAPTGTFIAYATAPNSTADDGEPGRNGIYTSELLRAMRVPGIPIEEVFKRVRQGVLTRTGGRQNPWEATNLTGPFYFALASGAPRPEAPPPPPYQRPPIVVEEQPQQRLGSLSFVSRADGVEVWLDDQRVGETRPGRALIVNNLSEGAHRARARKAGHEDWQREVLVTGNLRSEVLIDIEPLRAAPPKVSTRYEPLPGGGVVPPRIATRYEPLPTTAPGRGRLLFEDDFLRGARKAWVGSDKICAARYDAAGYDVTANNPNGTCEPRLTYAGQFPDAVRIGLSVQFRRGATNHLFGLKFGRASDASNDLYTVFGISGDGSYRLTQWYQGRWNPIIDWTKDPVVRTGYGATNHLAVEVSGRKIRCYINDKFVGAGTAFADVRGVLGFYLNQKDMEVVFTNLRVHELQ